MTFSWYWGNLLLDSMVRIETIQNNSLKGEFPNGF